MICNNCGGSVIGDGVTTVLHCENANEADYAHLEPDANFVQCFGAVAYEFVPDEYNDKDIEKKSMLTLRLKKLVVKHHHEHKRMEDCWYFMDMVRANYYGQEQNDTLSMLAYCAAMDDANNSTCPCCNGTGKVGGLFMDDAPKTCMTCNGRGE